MSAFDFGLSQFFGTGPVPPESVGRKVLGIGSRAPLGTEAVKAAFRFRVKLLRPDLGDAGADSLRLQDLTDEELPLFDAGTAVSFAAGMKAEQLAELLWARDDLLRRVPPPVTANGVAHEATSSRHCKKCGRKLDGWGIEVRIRSREDWGWRCIKGTGYCRPCWQDRKNAEAREERRRRRADRPCAFCGGTFTPQRSDGRYCKPACRQRAYRDRRAA